MSHVTFARRICSVFPVVIVSATAMLTWPAGSSDIAETGLHEDLQRRLQSESQWQFGKEPREVRIANCLRNASNAADQMALECERRHPKNKKGNAPGLSDCYDEVVDFLRIEQASCRRMR